jgi:hypothetical protein
MAISSALGSSALLPAGLGFRNVLINGAMTVYQRNASSTTSLASSFACDRWNNFRGGAVSGITVSRQTAGLTGFQYCSRIQRDSGNTATNALYFVQNVESVNSIPLAGKQVTLSFWARAGANYSASSGALRSSVEYATSTDSNYYTLGDGANTTVVSQNNMLTTTWQYFSMPATIAASQTQVFVGFKFTPVGTAGADDYYEITGVQLERNPQPTPFEQRPIGVELALCQRYYWRNTRTNGFFTAWYNPAYNTNSIDSLIYHPVTMRTTPTAFEYSNIQISDDIAFTVSGAVPRTISAYSTPNTSLITWDKAGSFTTRYYYALLAAGSGYIAVSAEL